MKTILKIQSGNSSVEWFTNFGDNSLRVQSGTVSQVFKVEKEYPEAVLYKAIKILNDWADQGLVHGLDLARLQVFIEDFLS